MAKENKGWSGISLCHQNVFSLIRKWKQLIRTLQRHKEKKKWMWKYDIEMAEELTTSFVLVFMDKFVSRPWCTPLWFWKEMDSRWGLLTKVIYIWRYLGPRGYYPKMETVILQAESWPSGGFPHDQQKKSSTHFLKRWKERFVK